MNPLLSEDDDSSLSNYQESTDSSLIWNNNTTNNNSRAPSNNHSAGYRNTSSENNVNKLYKNKNVSSGESNSEDDSSARINKLSLSQNYNSQHDLNINDNDNKLHDQRTSQYTSRNSSLEYAINETRRSEGDWDDSNSSTSINKNSYGSSNDLYNENDDVTYEAGSQSRIIKESKIAKTKLSTANNKVLDNLAKSFYFEHEQPLKPSLDTPADALKAAIASNKPAMDSNNTESSVLIDRQKIVEKILKPYEETKPQKILVRFQSIGSTSQIEPKIYKISNSQQFSLLIKFLSKKLKMQKDARDPLGQNTNVFCYIHNSFAPSPDEIIGNLFKNFATGNELVISYCMNVAFG